ncbi:tetratricopeptide repeat protein [Verrucomicrobiota bacterium sgz303538]
MFLLSRSIFRRWILLALAMCLPLGAIAQTDELSKLYPPAYVEIMEKAIRSFLARDYDGAVRLLDQADQLFAAGVHSLNMRGAIAIERKQFDEGAKYCQQALKQDPKFFPARFNLAEIPFVQKKYAEARTGFQKMLDEDPQNELLEYRVFLTYLLEGNDDAAKKALDEIKFPSNTASYYYANAAWEFAHGNEEKALGWIRSGDWVFPPSRNQNFADVLYDVGWLKRPGAQESAEK